jgi:hypothetical protein
MSRTPSRTKRYIAISVVFAVLAILAALLSPVRERGATIAADGDLTTGPAPVFENVGAPPAPR